MSNHDNNTNNPSSPGNTSELHPSVELLNSYLDDELPPHDKAVIATHLSKCATCRSDFAALQATASLLHQLPVPRPSRSFQLSAEQIQAKRRFPFLPPIRVHISIPQLAATLVVIVAMVITANLLNRDGTQGNLPAASQAPAITDTAFPSEMEQSDDATLSAVEEKPIQAYLPKSADTANDIQTATLTTSGNQSSAVNDEPIRPAAARIINAPADASPLSASPTSASLSATASPELTATGETASSQEVSPQHPSRRRIGITAGALILLWLTVSAIGLRRLRS